MSNSKQVFKFFPKVKKHSQEAFSKTSGVFNTTRNVKCDECEQRLNETQRFQTELKEFENERKEFENERKEFENERKEFENETQRSKHQYKNELEALENENKELENENKELENENKELENELEALKNENKGYNYNTQIIEEVNKKLNLDLVNKQILIDTLSKKCDELEKKNETYKNLISDKDFKIKVLTASETLLTNVKETLKKTAEENKQLLEKTREKLSKTEKDLAKTEKDLIKSEKKLDQTAKELSMTREKLSKTEKDLAKTEKELDQTLLLKSKNEKELTKTIGELSKIEMKTTAKNKKIKLFNEFLSSHTNKELTKEDVEKFMGVRKKVYNKFRNTKTSFDDMYKTCEDFRRYHKFCKQMFLKQFVVDNTTCIFLLDGVCKNKHDGYKLVCDTHFQIILQHNEITDSVTRFLKFDNLK